MCFSHPGGPDTRTLDDISKYNATFDWVIFFFPKMFQINQVSQFPVDVMLYFLKGLCSSDEDESGNDDDTQAKKKQLKKCIKSEVER